MFVVSALADSLQNCFVGSNHPGPANGAVLCTSGVILRGLIEMFAAPRTGKETARRVMMELVMTGMMRGSLSSRFTRGRDVCLADAAAVEHPSSWNARVETLRVMEVSRSRLRLCVAGNGTTRKPLTIDDAASSLALFVRQSPTQNTATPRLRTSHCSARWLSIFLCCSMPYLRE